MDRKECDGSLILPQSLSNKDSNQLWQFKEVSIPTCMQLFLMNDGESGFLGFLNKLKGEKGVEVCMG
jgi:hypothetical protein